MEGAGAEGLHGRVRWWRGRLKANRIQAEMEYGVRLGPGSPVWPFLAKYAADVPQGAIVMPAKGGPPTRGEVEF